MDLSFLLPAVTAETPPWAYYLCVGLAVVVTGLSKSGFGGGVGILAIPLMALVMPPTHMLGMMLPLLIACDILSNLHHLGHYDWKRLRWLLPGLISGIVVGTGILWYMRGMPSGDLNRVMNGVVGGVCLGVVVMQVYRLSGHEIPTLPPHPASAYSVGLAAGTVSTLNHSAGPIVTVYLLQERLEKRRMVGTLLIYFLIGNSLKLPTYALLPVANNTPLINARTLHDSIWFIPLIPVGTVLGAWMHHRVAEKPFAAIMYAAAAVAALDMLLRAIYEFSIFNPHHWQALMG